MVCLGEKKAKIILNPDAPGYVLSPYLFGMNAEVTRKSFFGGLSAQMLNNRKFYAGKDSPDGWECRESEYMGRREILLKRFIEQKEATDARVSQDMKQ